MLEPATLEAALHALGEVLEARRLAYDVVAAGGSSLMLLGLLERPTRDLDVVRAGRIRAIRQSESAALAAR